MNVMGIPNFRNCPGCGRKSQPIPENRKHIVADCDVCGFRATVAHMQNAEIIANFYPLPSIQQTAKRIANREMRY
jgi:transcription elongation factor Elf1